MALGLKKRSHQADVRVDDVDRLASLGYEQELKREFTPFQVFGVAFSIMGVLPSIASTIQCVLSSIILLICYPSLELIPSHRYNLPYGGPVSMIYGWLTSSFFILFIAGACVQSGSSCRHFVNLKH
jgi:hypothetical protein